MKTRKVSYRNKRNIWIKSTILSSSPCYPRRKNCAGKIAGGNVCITLSSENFFDKHFVDGGVVDNCVNKSDLAG